MAAKAEEMWRNEKQRKDRRQAAASGELEMKEKW
jgi:hypothetical protein